MSRFRSDIESNTSDGLNSIYYNSQPFLFGKSLPVAPKIHVHIRPDEDGGKISLKTAHTHYILRQTLTHNQPQYQTNASQYAADVSTYTHPQCYHPRPLPLTSPLPNPPPRTPRTDIRVHPPTPPPLDKPAAPAFSLSLPPQPQIRNLPREPRNTHRCRTILSPQQAV